MGWRGTVVLTLLVVVVGTYLWFEERPPPERSRPPTLLGEPRPVEPIASVPLLDFQPGDVIALRLQQEGRVRQAKRHQGKWRGAADPVAIDDLLKNLTTLGQLMEIPSDTGSLKDYGLDTPASSLELRLNNRASPLVLQIGDRNPATTGVYVRINQQGPVVLAGALVVWEFDKAFRALADTSAAELRP